MQFCSNHVAFGRKIRKCENGHIHSSGYVKISTCIASALILFNKLCNPYGFLSAKWQQIRLLLVWMWTELSPDTMNTQSTITAENNSYQHLVRRWKINSRRCDWNRVESVALESDRRDQNLITAEYDYEAIQRLLATFHSDLTFSHICHVQRFLSSVWLHSAHPFESAEAWVFCDRNFLRCFKLKISIVLVQLRKFRNI